MRRYFGNVEKYEGSDEEIGMVKSGVCPSCKSETKKTEQRTKYGVLITSFKCPACGMQFILPAE